MLENIYQRYNALRNVQSRSQSMPVRGLVVGMALAKPNEICNFIGYREINKTEIGIKR